MYLLAQLITHDGIYDQAKHAGKGAGAKPGGEGWKTLFDQLIQQLPFSAACLCPKLTRISGFATEFSSKRRNPDTASS